MDVVSRHVGSIDDGFLARTESCCARIGEAAVRLGARVAVAESLTGGSLAARLSATSGASSWFVGGIVAYDRSVKYELLGVPRGPVVTAEAAIAMVEGVARLFGADFAVSLSGVAGPGEQDGRPVGTVFFGYRDGSGACRAIERKYRGSPDEIVESAIVEALELFARGLSGDER